MSSDPRPPRQAGRLRPIVDPVTVELDGEPIVAERGEPLCEAFVAAGELTLARSPKFHRPRGPSCMRGACDGCLARVDDRPNVMTCLVPAEDGTRVTTQNYVGTRDADLLRMTDWFFPEGMNHHELFAGIPGVQSVMQAFARRVAGLGKLPSEAAEARPAARRATDVVIVGAGASGVAVATRLARAGRAVEVIDDALAPGGGTLALDAAARAPFDATLRAFAEAVHAGAIRLRSRTTAGSLYGRDLLVVGPDGAEVVEARALVLACGAHDGQVAFEGNDVPGVMSARAAGWMLARGVLVGRRVAVVVPEGGGPFGEAFARALASATADLREDERPTVEVVHGDPLRARGSSRVRSILVRTARGDRELVADAVLVDAPRSPAYELGEQAGAALDHQPRGFVVRTTDGRVAEGVFACGEMVGLPLEHAALEADAERVAARILADGGTAR